MSAISGVGQDLMNESKSYQVVKVKKRMPLGGSKRNQLNMSFEQMAQGVIVIENFKTGRYQTVRMFGTHFRKPIGFVKY